MKRAYHCRGQCWSQSAIAVQSSADCKAEAASKVYPLNLANQRSVAPDEISEYDQRERERPYRRMRILAENKPLIKLVLRRNRSPIAGVVESG